MKVVILAGGLGTRLAEETSLKPKPMIEIGGYPILWHIMKIYSSYGYNEFIICLGYMGYKIKEYFANYFLHQADVTIDISNNSLEFHKSHAEPWKITLVDTGTHTMTGGRILRVKNFLKNEMFHLTYGDGVGNIDINKLVSFHKAHQKIMTVTSVQPSGRFGAMNLDKNNVVKSFLEKPKGDNSWINGGFFVCQPEVIEYIEGDHSVLEKEPMQNIAIEGHMLAYLHKGFWKPMDTLRDYQELKDLWESGNAPWKKW